MASKHLQKPNKAAKKKKHQASSPPNPAEKGLREVLPPTPEKEKKAKPEKKPKEKKAKKLPAPTSAADFRLEQTEEEKRLRKELRISRKDSIGALITFAAAMILFAATMVIWSYQDSFNTDDLILSTITAAVAEDEYVFDAGSGQVFASTGQGLAVANSTGFELLDSAGSVAASKLLQMTSPTIAACDSFAIFYDLGGTNIAAADFEGNLREMSVEGDILSVTISSGGYTAVTTECTGYRALVTVYDAEFSPVYQWYSSSAWVISACVSPDNRNLAVLSYTASGSEVRLFSLSETEQKAAFSVSDKVLLDVHWFSSERLCAYTSGQVFFFDSSGHWFDTYSFADQYLIACATGGDGFITFALSPYLAGTTAVLVSLDSLGKVLGTADIQSEIISLTADSTEILTLCADGAILYSSSLAEKGRITGLPGFKYGLIRARGEALLIASNYAEVYKF